MTNEQQKVFLPEEYWDYIKAMAKKHGQYKSQFIRSCIDFARAHKKGLVRCLENKELSKWEQIGAIARRDKAVRFAIAFAPKNLKQEIEGLKEALAAGMITKKEFAREVIEAKKRIADVIKIQLSKRD